MNALEEMYPQGEKVIAREFPYLFFLLLSVALSDIHYGAG
jgi:hypothetical protein